MASIDEKTPVVMSVAHTPEGTALLSNDKQQTTVNYATEQPLQDSAGAANEKHLRVSTSTPPGAPRASDLSTPDSARLNPFETDIEAMITHSNSTTAINSNCTKSTSKKACGSDSQVWPGQGHWKKKAKEAKMQRSCTCLSRLSKRNRIIAHIVIGVLIVGIAVAVGFGVSKPLGASIWKPRSR